MDSPNSLVIETHNLSMTYKEVQALIDGIDLMVEQGVPLPAMAVSQLISTAVLSIVFTLVAVPGRPTRS